MTPEDLAASKAALQRAEMQHPLHWWWLSFAVPGQGNLGCAIVRARGVLTAAEEAFRLGANPGGEKLAYPIPGGKERQHAGSTAY